MHMSVYVCMYVSMYVYIERDVHMHRVSGCWFGLRNSS